MRRSWFLLIAFAAGSLAASLAGCGKHPAARPAPGPATGTAKPSKTAQEAPGTGEPPAPTVAPGGAAARPGYERRVETLKGIDTSALVGRRIMLDPGHGGRFPGSIGPQGLTEAEVNLGVALHLWGLLTDAGADVRMTRTTDRDFRTPADSSLRADLAARVAISNAFAPDVFLSIHHNADAGGRHDLNETQTYYKFSDPDASYDLGQAIHRHLTANLGIGADRLLPGNYFVVRNAAGAAVLGESSYLTNPAVEFRLALAAKQRLEAEAYFLGLVDYFAHGVPRIVATRTDPVPGGADPIDGSERPWLVAQTDRAPGTARLTLDGVPADTVRMEKLQRGSDGRSWQVRWRPLEPLTDGKHRVEWAVRAAGGNWSNVKRDSFVVDLPVAKTVLEVAPRSGLAPGGIAGLTLRALDRHGRAVSDTVVARFSAHVGAAIVDSLAPRTVTPGEARAYARATGGSAASFAATVVNPRVRPELVQLEARATLAAPGATESARATTGFARTPVGLPVAGAVVRGDPADTAVATTNADGFFALPTFAATPAAEAPGYVTAAAPAGAATGPLRLVPIVGGALLGKHIALDPGGGGADTTGLDAAAMPPAAVLDPGTPQSPAAPDSSALDTSLTAPFPLTAPGDTLAARRAQVIEADANVRVARALREYLEAAGAQVVLTRDRPESLTAIDRLRRTEAFAPDRVVTIAHRARAGTASAGHYFSSPQGTALARRIAARLDTRGVTKGARVVESASYLVQQTAAIAVAVNAPDALPLYADSTRGARRLREEAYALYLALLEDLGGDASAFTPLAVNVKRAGAPAPGVPVELDGRWILISGPDGLVRFDGLPAGAAVTVSAGPSGTLRVTLPATAPVTLEPR